MLPLILPAVLSFAASALSWLVPVLLGVFLLFAGYIFRFGTAAGHHQDIRAVDNALLQIYNRIVPTHRSPWRNYIHMAEVKGVLPPEDDATSHVLDRVPATPYKGVAPIALVATDHNQLTVTNNTGIVMEVTCQQAPTFASFLRNGETVALPNTIESPATIIAQGYFEDFSTVKLVHQVDIHQVSSVYVDKMDGIVRMHASS